MKYIVLFLLSFNVYADVSLTLQQSSMLTADDTYQTNNWTGVEGKYIFDNDLYIVGSYEQFGMVGKAYITTVSMIGLGVGMRKKLSDNFRFFGHLAYYKVDNSFDSGERNEGLFYHFEKFDNKPNFTSYAVETEDTFGGTVGVEYIYPLAKNFDVGMSVSYRLLKLPQRFVGNISPGVYWEDGNIKDYSSINLGIVTNIVF